MYYRMVSSISGLYPLDVQLGQSEMSPDIAKYPLDGWESPPVENPWLRGPLFYMVVQDPSFIGWSSLQIPFLLSELVFIITLTRNPLIIRLSYG